MATVTQAKIDKISYADFLEQDHENAHVEWVDGEATPLNPVSNRHQDIAGFFIALLRAFVEERHLGKVLYRPFQMKIGLDLPGRSPDILFVANTNLPHLRSTYLDGPADLAVEIISPESQARDRGDKFYEYEQGGVSEY